MGRPGLDPGTLGSQQARPTTSIEIHLSWSEGVTSPPLPTEVLSNLSLWLHDWLHKLGYGGVGVILSTGADGARIEIRVEVP